MGEKIVTNPLQKSLVFNQQRLLRKRNLTRVPDGRFGDVNVDQRLAIGRYSPSMLFYNVILCRHILCTLPNVSLIIFFHYLKQNENVGKFRKLTLHFVFNMTS